MCIGHVDVKFSLHPSCQRIPSIQVTLLRLKNSGSKASDDQSSFQGMRSFFLKIFENFLEACLHFFGCFFFKALRFKRP